MSKNKRLSKIISDPSFIEGSSVFIIGNSDSKDDSFSEKYVNKTGIVLHVKLEGISLDIKIISVIFTDDTIHDFFPEELSLGLF